MPGARDWCPIVSDVLGFKAAAGEHAAQSSPAPAAAAHEQHVASGHGSGHAEHAALAPASAPDHGEGHGAHAGTHECPGYASKLAAAPGRAAAGASIVRIAIAHAYATREAARLFTRPLGPPTGVRGPPHLA